MVFSCFPLLFLSLSLFLSRDIEVCSSKKFRFSRNRSNSKAIYIYDAEKKLEHSAIKDFFPLLEGVDIQGDNYLPGGNNTNYY